MQFKQCPQCGNSDTTYKVIKCIKCKKIVGCFKERSFAGKMFNTSLDGCSGVEDIYSKCPQCNGKAGYFGSTFDVYPIID